MHGTVFIERADTYLSAQWRESRSPWIRRTTAPFVTISREAGSGGSSLARLLARKLNAQAPPDTAWKVFEGNLTARMLHDHHLPVRFARYLPEDQVPELKASIAEFVGLHPSLWELVQKTKETMRRLAEGGNVILVGRGANFATRGIHRGFHIRLVAPAAHRAHYLAQRYNISEKEAHVLNAKFDAARQRYVKATFGTNVADPTAYDLVINTAQVTLDQAASLICTRLADL